MKEEQLRVCAREGCENELNTGATYCSRACSNARNKPKEDDGLGPSDITVVRAGGIPKDMEDALYKTMGRNRANMVMKEIQEQIAVRAAEPKRTDGRTKMKPPTNSDIESDIEGGYGGYRTWNSYLSDFRRSTSISVDDVKLMQRCGIIVFGSRVKKAPMITSLANHRYWSVKSTNKELAAVSTVNLERIFQMYGMDIMESLDYGAVFMSKQWAYKTAAEIGVDSDDVSPDSEWWVIDKLHTAPPWKVEQVLRKKSNHEFVGYVHRRDWRDPKEVTIKTPRALVLNYNSKFGNIWGQSIYEPVWDYWFWYEVVMRSFLRYLERMGTPVTVCRSPSRGSVQRPDGSVVTNAEWGMVVAGNVAHSSAVWIPSDVDPVSGNDLWGLEYLSADAKGEQFIRALEILGTSILRGMVIGDRAATQAGETGSYAAAQVHSSYTELDNDLIYKGLVGQWNRWVMNDYGRYNVDPNEPPTVTLETEGLDPREKERIMSIVNTAGNQVLGSGSAFDLLDWSTMFTAVDLPVLTEEQRKEMKEQMTKEALDKQERFNELQAKIEGPAGASPFAKKNQPSPGKQKRQQEPQGQARQKMYEDLARGAMVPVLLHRDDVLDLLPSTDRIDLRLGRSGERAMPDGEDEVSDPEFEKKHPRDEYGRFVKKDEEGDADGDYKEKYSFLDEEPWPGADPDMGVKGVFTIDGVEYEAVGDVSKEDIIKMNELNQQMYERADAIYPLEKTGVVIYDVNSPEDVVLRHYEKFDIEYTQQEFDEVVESLDQQGGFFAMYDHDGNVVIDNGLLDRPEYLESILFHEALHTQPRITDKDRGGVERAGLVEETYNTLITMEYDEKYGLPVTMGYAPQVSRAAMAMLNLGWSKEKLYDFARGIHKLDGPGYGTMHSMFLQNARVDMHEDYPYSLQSLAPDWEQVWLDIADVYGQDGNEWIKEIWN